mmetsp:Transcript_6207/g.9153  ORF Transcript_6207/g.9153 Transcript_6207/m.9153 type:complete len:81 (-) Transcript_6207:309-551(-)
MHCIEEDPESESEIKESSRRKWWFYICHEPFPCGISTVRVALGLDQEDFGNDLTLEEDIQLHELDSDGWCSRLKITRNKV